MFGTLAALYKEAEMSLCAEKPKMRVLYQMLYYHYGLVPAMWKAKRWVKLSNIQIAQVETSTKVLGVMDMVYHRYITH